MKKIVIDSESYLSKELNNLRNVYTDFYRYAGSDIISDETLLSLAIINYREELLKRAADYEEFKKLVSN